MMTFERCGGYLNTYKQLKADDGTLISVNGKSLCLVLHTENLADVFC